jgi:hypothetical protein
MDGRLVTNRLLPICQRFLTSRISEKLAIIAFGWAETLFVMLREYRQLVVGIDVVVRCFYESFRTFVGNPLV